ncbi:WGR domain-containing protein [Sulfitobacter sp. S190]|nr:WGR domain-containing protein [Sulfitobacter sp. S190]UWR24251.1 WGR domain-containing protein [Sulfitobacter sp. S190]
MLDCLMYRTSSAQRALFYRVEIAMTLFSDVSVTREWGVAGGKPRRVLHHFNNWRDASLAADAARQRAQKRGYARN